MSGTASKRKNAWVFAIGVLIAALAPCAPSAASTSDMIDRMTAEPFGMSTMALPEGPLVAKWHGVEAAIEAELKIIAQCRADRANCASAPALQFLAIVDAAASSTGLARVGQINRAFNLTIKAMSDQAQYGVEDLWTSPLATLAAGAGDCEDYAIAKMVALREAGLSADDLRLVILRDMSNGEDHAVAAARVEGRWRMLDNRQFLMLADSDVAKLQPVFAFDHEGAKRFVDPAMLIASAQQPSVVAAPAAQDAEVTASPVAPEYVIASYDADVYASWM